MRRSYVFGRADEMAVRRLNAMAFNELDIVSSLKRTGDPTLGDRHEYRTPLSPGVPLNVIALWLGPEGTATTHQHVEPTCP